MLQQKQEAGVAISNYREGTNKAGHICRMGREGGIQQLPFCRTTLEFTYVLKLCFEQFPGRKIGLSTFSECRLLWS